MNTTKSKTINSHAPRRTNPARNSLQGKINRAAGRAFEERIDLTFEYYRKRGFALIDKTPEPTKILKKEEGGKFIGEPLKVLLRVFGFSRESTLLFLDSRKLEAGTMKLGEEFDVRRLVKNNIGYSDHLIKDISDYFWHKKITIVLRSEYDGSSRRVRRFQI